MIVNRRNVLDDARNLYPDWAHPDVLRNANTWRMIRDCIAGEEAIKARTTEYLPQLTEQEEEDYRAYLQRAVYFNMAAKTVRAMTGLAFGRKPKVTGVPKKCLKRLWKATYENVSLDLFIKTSVEEVLSLGRYGILVEMERIGLREPYFAPFAAESIIDWETKEIDGRLVLSGVILRSIGQTRSGLGKKRELSITYRFLELVWDEDRKRHIYRQRIYDAGTDSNIDFDAATYELIVPTRNGVPLGFIPFVMPGAMTTTPAVDASPVRDICSLNLNISHYRSYAELEHFSAAILKLLAR